jgi:hypothetical protein
MDSSKGIAMADTKSGRVLSAANHAKLKQAHGLMAEVLADHESRMEDMKPNEEAEPMPMETKKKSRFSFLLP